MAGGGARCALMKAARCAPALCDGKPNGLAAGTASHQSNFLAARLNGMENSTKRPGIRRMSDKGVRREGGAFQWVQAPPGELAPAGSNRSSHGGNEMAEAFD